MPRPLRRPRWLPLVLSPATVPVTALVTVLVVSGLPGPARAAVTEGYAVPADGVLRLTGHGYGHGHGLSQYGAQGAAAAGLDYRRIVAFYYPGTTMSTTGGDIRVLVSADTDGDVRVLPAAGLRVRQVGSGSSYALPTPAGVTTWRLRTSGSVPVLDYYDGRWHGYAPGGVALTGEAEFHRDGPLTLRVAGGTRTYRGALRLSQGRTVDVLPLEDYLRGVVPREMPASWRPAAVRAQAVAARTYAAYERSANATRSYQTCDTTSCQVYGGVDSEHPASDAAVAATAGEVLTSGGRPAFTQFSASNGGWTSAGSVPYLAARADPYDGYAGNPVHTWSTTLTRAAVQQRYPALGTLRRVEVGRRDGHGDWSGRVEQLVLVGSRGRVPLTGDGFRSAFGLRSSWFVLGPVPEPPRPTTPASTTPAAPAPLSAITLRWREIGGYRSVLGGPRSPEHTVPGGSTRRFARGRIYAAETTGARELYGRVLRPYLRRGATRSRLGFPVGTPHRFARGVYADFEHGTIRVLRSGKVRVRYA